MRHSYEHLLKGWEREQGLIKDFEKTIWISSNGEKKKKSPTIFSWILASINKMKSNGTNVSNIKVIEEIFRTLMWFEYKVTIVEESKDPSAIILNKLMGSLQAHE